MKLISLGAVAIAGAIWARGAAADTIDLTTKGSSGLGNGAWYIQTDPQPTGTGYIDPFVRIENKGSESGYNTDYRPVEFDTKDQNHWTHSIQVTDVPLVTHMGGQYRQFLLDINEGGNSTDRYLSLNKVEIYLGPTGSEHNYPNLGDLIYSLDTPGNDHTVELNYKLNHGSGSGDMFLLVPNDLFNLSSNSYIYLYSSFGVPHSAEAGFEEWAVTGSGPPQSGSSAPLPAVAWSGIALLAGSASSVGRGRRTPA